MRNVWRSWHEAAMSNIPVRLALIGSIFIFSAGGAIPASAQPSVCNNETSANCPPDRATRKKRPRVTIYPRYVYPRPYAKRQCRSWLAKEYRVSGPVIVPQMRCWWE
jgi:hypothetical protein